MQNYIFLNNCLIVLTSVVYEVKYMYIVFSPSKKFKGIRLKTIRKTLGLKEE